MSEGAAIAVQGWEGCDGRTSTPDKQLLLVIFNDVVEARCFLDHGNERLVVLKAATALTVSIHAHVLGAFHIRVIATVLIVQQSTHLTKQALFTTHCRLLGALRGVRGTDRLLRTGVSIVALLMTAKADDSLID